jgi:fucose 4-O-acetylase-like acetyltransferase
MHPAPLSSFTSLKFRYWNFVSMLLVVWVHAYNLKYAYLQPWTVPDEPLTVNSFIQYFTANGLARFVIPLLFLISGYLYALQDNRPYRQRTLKRFRTLLIPYLIWSAIGLLFTYILELFPYTKQMIAGSHLLQINSNTFLLHQYKWNEWLVRWILFPIPYQLWFLLVLFVYNAAYPWLLYCVTNPKAQKIFFPLAILFWLMNLGTPLVEGEGLLFFSLGILIQKRNINIKIPGKWLQPIPWFILFLCINSFKTWLAFKGQPFLGNSVYPTLLLLHKIVVVSALITCWFGSDKIVQTCMQYPVFRKLTGFAFIIYAMHVPLLFYVNALLFPLMQTIPNFRLLLYIGLPFTIMLFCIGTGVLLKKISPLVYALLMGGR